MLTPDETNVILQFLDRTPITGHRERQAMNAVCDSLQKNGQPTAPQKEQFVPVED